MAFAFSQIEPNRLGTVSHWDIPINTWMGLKWENGYESTMGRSISKMTEDFLSEGPQLTPEDANAQWSIPGEGGLIFRESINAGRAQLMNERKRAELDRLSYLDAAGHNALSAKGIAGFGAALVGGLSHPLDLGISFIPLFGQEAKGVQMAKAGAGAARQRIATGLIGSEEGLIRAGVPFPRVTASAIEGMVGNAIAEIPTFIQNSRDQAQYGIEDSAINVLAGGAFAGGVRALGRALEHAMGLYLRLDSRVRDAANAHAIGQFLASEQIDVGKIVNVDEAAIRDRVRFDEGAARQEAEAQLSEVNARPSNESQNAVAQSGDWRKSFDEAPDIETKIDWLRAVANNRGTKASEQDMADVLDRALQLSDNQTHSRLANTFWDVAHNPASSDTTRLEALALYNEFYTPGPKRATDEREQRIQRLIDSKRKDWNEDARFQAEKQKEIARQQAQGKILPDEEIKRLSFKETPDEADLSAVKEDAANLEKELNANPERPLSEAEQKSLDTIQSYEKAVDAAVPCVIKSLLDNA